MIEYIYIDLLLAQTHLCLQTMTTMTIFTASLSMGLMETKS